MKPGNWNEMTDIEKHDMALNLMRSMRGALIMSQALVRAIEVMRAAPGYPEESNIQDMEMLLELFPIYQMVAASQAEWAKMPKPKGKKK